MRGAAITGAKHLIGADGLIGAHRIDFIGERDVDRKETQDRILSLRDDGYSTEAIADRVDMSQSAVYCVLKKFGRIKDRRGEFRSRKVKSITKVETALEHVDEVRVFRGEDTEAGEPTYIVSLCDEQIIGQTRGSVAQAINCAMQVLWERKHV